MTAILALMLCESLAKLTLPNTTITNAHIVAANLPAFRRVQATITPSADAHIEVEVWLPQTRWNGKYLGSATADLAAHSTTTGSVRLSTADTRPKNKSISITARST